MRNQNTHKNMKHISNKVVEYVLHVYVCAVFKSVCKTNMDPS